MRISTPIAALPAIAILGAIAFLFAGPAAVAQMTAVPEALGPNGEGAAVVPDFRLGPGDEVLIMVIEDPALDTTALVRPDGMISVPVAGAVMAAGRTPEELAAAVRQQLSDAFLEPPTVHVALLALGEPEEQELLSIYVLGEVNNPGRFEVKEPIGLLQALSLAGGPGTFAAKRRVQVRQATKQGVERVTVVNYDAIEEGAAAPGLLLGDGDTVVVPERGLFE